MTTAAEVGAVQRRTVRVLAAGQVLGSVAFGSTVSLGALLATDISGQEALSGLATAGVTLGAAVCAIPLSRLAGVRGRRVALSVGNLLAILGIVTIVTSAVLRVFPLLLAGALLIGMGNAGNLQARFAATDLAEPSRRGRDLGVVVWATTVGGVVGPLLITPGEALGAVVGMPPLTGAYLFSGAVQLAAFALYLVALRPDPLLVARERASAAGAAVAAGEDRPILARFAMLANACSHVTMASVMAMTPIHLAHVVHPGHHGAVDPAAVTAVVGLTISLHIFGMYGFSPVFGRLADRIGRVRVILIGQGVLVLALGVIMIGGDVQAAVITALVLLGMGWSASTVAGAALLTESSILERRPRRQGLNDTLMAACAACGAVLAGVALAAWGYRTLAAIALMLVATVIVGAMRTRRAPRVAA